MSEIACHKCRRMAEAADFPACEGGDGCALGRNALPFSPSIRERVIALNEEYLTEKGWTPLTIGGVVLWWDGKHPHPLPLGQAIDVQLARDTKEDANG